MITKEHLTTQLADNLAGIIAESILKEEGLTTNDDQYGGFLIPTEQDKRLEWEIKYWQDWIKQITDPWEKKFKKKMLELFEAQKREVLGNMKKSPKSMLKQDEGDIGSWLFGRKTWEKRFKKEGLPLIKGIAIDNGSKVLGELPVVGVSFDVKNPLVKKLLEERSIKFAEVVVGTTEERLRTVLAAGIDAGKSIPDLKDDVLEWFKTASPDRAEKIARTETIWASNAGAEQAYIQSEVVEGKEWLVADDERLCEFCEATGNEFGIDQGNKLAELFYELGDKVKGTKGGKMEMTYEGIQHPPLHVRCLLDPQIPIYTSKGWIPIGKIEVGDLVLSHKGRFKRVTEAIRTPKQTPDVTRIALKGREDQYLTLTDGHPILLNGEWRGIEETKIGDKIGYLSSECKRCEKDIPQYLTYCSLSCNSKDITDRQWTDPKHRENMSCKASDQMNREYADGTRDKFKITKGANKKTRQLAKEGKLTFQQNWVKEKSYEANHQPHHRKASSERMKRNNPSCNPEVRKRMTETYRKTMLKHPEKHPNFIMAQNGFISSLEKKVEDVLISLGIAYARQHPIKRYFVDFALLNKRIAIEADGEYWHQDKERDLKRQEDIEKEGWIVLRFPEKQILKNVDRVRDEILRVVNNHDGKYHFLDMEIAAVEKWKIKRPRMLYNLSVEEDESYIAKGFVVHNCRCTLVPKLIEVTKENLNSED